MTVESAGPKVTLGRRLVRFAAWVVLTPMVLVLSLWAVLAIHFSNLPEPWMRTAAAIAWGVAALCALLLVRPRLKGLAVFALLWCGVATWNYFIPCSNEAKEGWQPDVAQLVTSTLDGDKLTIHNVRNSTYRAEFDYDVKWETRTYDLTKLHGMDLMMVYWGSPYIAHAMVSFEFEDPSSPGGYSYVTASIETRKRNGQEYSAVQGLFKQFALIYTIADERDVVGLRTNFRHEQVFMYRMPGERKYWRAMLLKYMERCNAMATEPEWYNAVTSSCFTNVLFQNREVTPNPLPWFQVIDYRLLADGKFDTFMYERGRINTSLPFEQLREKSLVNAKVDKSPIGPDFSVKIREGLPPPPTVLGGTPRP